MTQFKKWNLILGWIVFAVSAFVYLSTIEPTASFWDCGEFITTAYRMEVGHPPGAPFFMILGRFFTLFAGSPDKAALAMNAMSALASAFTIMFLFWTISHLAGKIIGTSMKEWERGDWLKVWAAGIVGAMAYAFSDTFWFSAVEAEVYATSSLFTAVVFWAILKWENIADKPHSNRWIILIAYLMGLSIGVHLLNLLAIPAIIFVYYFKKYEVTRNGVIKAAVLSVVILGAFMYVLIPGIIKIASWFELLFVNGFGLPFNTGIVIYALLLIGGTIYGILYTQKKGLVIANTVLTIVAVIIIGYSSFAMVVIRSSADPPMDQNNPEHVFNLLSYLNREQYGERPLVHGAAYNAPLASREQGKAVYEKVGDRYEVVDYKAKLEYDDRFVTLFPRMWSGNDPQHAQDYENWVDINGRTVSIQMGNGQTERRTIPSFGDHMAFFFKYQVGHMYLRYFMWNFAGRQNDRQGHGNLVDGNWLSGINFIDEARLGPQDNLPDWQKNNPARNTYYMLPLLLGLLGLIYHYKKQKNDFIVIAILFVLTGVAIVVYLNQYPHQPRERDYAYAGSFYAFSIWIGLGVMWLVDLLNKVMKKTPASITAFVLSFLLVPALMASENWDDHDRSGSFIAVDMASNYLNSCEEDAILFTNGDNDTFPLWYAQEVEGIRTDVRVANLSYLRAGWYIEQLARKAYDSDPIPIKLKPEQYLKGTRDVVPVMNRIDRFVDIREVMDFVRSDDSKTKMTSPFDRNQRISYMPTKKYFLPIDSAEIIEKGVLEPKYADRMVDEIRWTANSSLMLKDGLIVHELMAVNDWERPIYWSVTVGSSKYFNLDSYFKMDGLAYRITPVKVENRDGYYGWIQSDNMYDLLVNKFKWGGVEDTSVYMNENSRRMYSNSRSFFGRLAGELIKEGKEDSARLVMERSLEKLPHSRIQFSFPMLSFVENYIALGDKEKAQDILNKLGTTSVSNLEYYRDVSRKDMFGMLDLIRRDLYIVQQLSVIARNNGLSEEAAFYQGKMQEFMDLFARMG